MLTEREIETMAAFLTVEEVARILRLKRSTAYEYVRQGIIPCVGLGSFIRMDTKGAACTVDESGQAGRWRRDGEFLTRPSAPVLNAVGRKGERARQETREKFLGGGDGPGGKPCPVCKCLQVRVNIF
ncbi:helix-turn-helix domain-containing protein [Desulfofundulus sp. TPOSR]|uniref:helix-turn-helix domain-containing protein n=1 Tax=Desulfofundulus sp. TPOSR TaxID=2714340 RepID=UPI001A9AE292|nr:helix-turn-helix domain-containing protein [Desulfofundulus sp. TPOSR]